MAPVSEYRDILIVGAGPVGLSLALALSRLGISVQVFETLPELSSEARASTFHPPTLEMFAEWGVLDELLAYGYRVNEMQYWERETRELVASFDYSSIAADTAYPFRLQCPQNILTKVLKPHIENSPFGKVHMQHTLTAFTDCDTHVEAIFDTPNGQRMVKGAFLCAADGSKSMVRKILNLSFEGMTYADRFLLIATTLDLKSLFPGLGAVSYIFDPDEWIIVLHLPDITRIVFRIKDDEDILAVQTEESIRSRMAQFTGQALNFEIKGVSIYSVHQRVADTFRKGRVLLLGDAAHINNPLGGMGMNSGIHDAYCLASKLADVMLGAPDTLLDEYNQERRKAAIESVQSASDKNYRDMTAAEESQRLSRNQQLRNIAADPQKTRQYLLRASMLEHRISRNA